MLPIAQRAVLLGASAIRYLLRATFSQDMAAPLPASLPVDVGGPLTTVQVDGQLSQNGGKLVFPAQTTPAWGDLRIDGAALTRVVGRTLISEISLNVSGSFGPQIGWDSNTAGEISPYSFYVAGANVSPGSGFGNVITAFASNTTYQIAHVLRSTGAFLFIKGGAFTNWTLLWVWDAATTTPLFPTINVYDRGGTLDNFRVLDLATFAADAQVYTNRLTSVSAGATTTHAADAWIEFTFSYNGTVMYFQYRRTSATNSWEVDADSGTVYLYQVVAGVYTSRGSSGSTFTATNTYRVVIVAEGNVHKVYTQLSGAAPALKITYTDAGNFQNTATGISVDAVSASMSEVVAWPRTVTLPNV